MDCAVKGRMRLSWIARDKAWALKSFEGVGPRLVGLGKLAHSSD